MQYSGRNFKKKKKSSVVVVQLIDTHCSLCLRANENCIVLLVVCALRPRCRSAVTTQWRDITHRLVRSRRLLNWEAPVLCPSLRAEFWCVQRVRIPWKKHILRVSTFEADDWGEENRPEVKLEPQCRRAAAADSGSGVDNDRREKRGNVFWNEYFHVNKTISVWSNMGHGRKLSVLKVGVFPQRT